MKKLSVQCENHIFVCCNERAPDHPTPCCKHVGGEEIYQAFKDHVAHNGLIGKVWVTRTRCLGFCNKKGTTIVIYPQGLWLTEVSIEDIDNIFTEL